MMADTNPLNLYQKLLKITEEIGKIEKTGTNTAQGYKFIEQARVVAEVRVQLAKYGVMIIPETVSRKIDRYTTMKPGYQGKPDYEQASYHVNVVSRYTIVNADNPDERIVCDWDAGEALDTSDKATNKATTASEKYFLMKLLKISDQDDPDAESPAAPATPPKNVAEASFQSSADDPATESQLKYIRDLRKRLGYAEASTETNLKLVKTKGQAKASIDKLKAELEAKEGGSDE